MRKARITGLGSYLPSRILSNHDLEKMVETTDEWIVSRTGIKERRIAAKDEYTSDMGAAAARKALASAGLLPSQIDLIIVSSMTPDYISPSTAALIQHQLNASKAAAVDIQAACTGFLYALSMAKAYVESAIYQNVLVIAAEKMSSIIDYNDRNTCVLFGDGAAAAVVTHEGEGFAIKTIRLGADGELAPLVSIPGGGSRHPATSETVAQGYHYFKMVGREVFKYAVRHMSAAAKECLKLAGIRQEELSWIVPHQANERILDAISKNFDFPAEKIYKTLHKYGNTSASSVAIALDELTQETPFASGEHLLLLAFGGGLTWGAALLTKTMRKDEV